MPTFYKFIQLFVYLLYLGFILTGIAVARFKDRRKFFGTPIKIFIQVIISNNSCGLLNY